MGARAPPLQAMKSAFKTPLPAPGSSSTANVASADDPSSPPFPHFRLLVLLLSALFLYYLPRCRPAAAAVVVVSGGTGDCAPLLAAAVALLPPPGTAAPLPTLLLAGTAPTGVQCLLLTLPQRPAAPRCRQTVSGTWPDDFEVRLEFSPPSVDSRTLPLALLHLLPSSSSNATHYGLALPPSVLRR